MLHEIFSPISHKDIYGEKKKKIVKKGPLMRKADSLQSQYWREKIGRCEKCGGTHCLQVAHINTRDIRGIRYDRRNLLVLCASCHTFFHDYPTRFTEFVKEKKTPEDYEYIHTYTSQSGIATIEFYKEKIEKYKLLNINKIK